MNNSISPKVTALHPADLESGDSGALETIIKHCMDAKVRYTPLGPRLLGLMHVNCNGSGMNNDSGT